MKHSFFSLILLPVVFFVSLCSLSTHADAPDFNLSANISPYIPNIDNSTQSDGSLIAPIYKNYYNGKTLPQFGLDVDFHLINYYGTLTLGFGLMYAYASGKAKKANDPSQELDSKVALHIAQIRPQLTYIFDPYVEIVPFAPYLRAGIVGAAYFNTLQGSLDHTNPLNSPSGMVFGWEAAGGLLFLLDVLQPNVAQQSRGRGIIQHSYLKAEFAYMPINNFGRKGWNLSPKWFGNSNLPFALTFGLMIEF